MQATLLGARRGGGWSPTLIGRDGAGSLAPKMTFCPAGFQETSFVSGANPLQQSLRGRLSTLFDLNNHPRNIFVVYGLNK